MTDTSELPYEAATPYGQSVAPVTVGDTTPTDINSLLQQATQMANEGGPGANADKAQAWLEQQMQVRGSINAPGSEDGVIPYEGVSPLTEVSPKEKGQEYKPAPLPVDSTATRIGKSFLTGVQTSILDPFNKLQAEIGNYIENPQQRTSEEGGTVTPEQKAAAKLIGADVGNQWGPILKMSPDELAKARANAMQSFGLNPAEQAARDEAIAKGETYSGPVEGLLQHSAVKDLLGQVYNPNESNTLLYHKVNEIVHLQDVVSHPDKYAKDEVQSAQQVLDQYKVQASKGTWQKLKESLQEIKKHPLALVNATLADPELFLAPEAKVGEAAYSTKIAQATDAAEKAQQLSKVAQSVEKSATAMPDVKVAAQAQAAHYGQQAQKLLESAKRLNAKRYAADVASGAISGSAINAGITAAQESGQQGYVQKGSLEAPAVMGAALGGGIPAIFGKGKIAPYEAVKPLQESGVGEELPKPTATLLPQTGNVDKALLATGAAAGLGGTAGAILSPEGQKEKGALAGAFGGLFLGLNMHGESIPSKGFGNAERGMFAGPRARTNDLFKEALANRLEREGVSAPEIHQQTGLFREAGGKWSHELPDKGISINEDVLKQTSQEHGGKEDSVPLSQVLNHPEMEKAYPDLMKNLKVRQISVENLGGYYDPQEHSITLNDPSYLRSLSKATGDRSIMPESILAHEVQHAIDHYERMPRGDSPNPHLQELQQQRMSLEDRWDNLNVMKAKAQADGDSAKVRQIAQIQGEINKRLTTEFTTKAIQQEARKRYLASAGEQKAINVQNRLDMTPEERAKAFPPETMSVPYEQQRIQEQPNQIQYHELPPIEEVKDNYTKELGKYGTTMYHETSPDGLFYIAPKGRSSTDVGDIYVSNTPDLATGQHANKGVMVQFDANKLKGQINKAKPTWEYSWKQGQGEFITRHMRGSDYRNAVKAFTVKSDAQVSAVDRMRLKTLERDLVGEGWHKTVSENGDITYSKPKEGVSYHQLPLEDHLKATGDMDEEGKLHGLTLEEDKLPNEKAVIDRARSGDQQAIATLYKKYMPRLERTLRSVMREAGPRLGIGSEDIASQAFMKAVQALPSFEGVSSFYTWLYRIGRNEALNAIDKGNRTVPVSSMYKGTSGEPGLSPLQGGIEDVGGSPIRSDVESVASTHDTPEAMATAQQASNMVRYAISKLPQDIKEAIKMKELVGLTEQEIAQAQGVPVGTVKSRLSRGREMLAQSIKRGHGANFRKQGGFATPEQMKRLAKTATLLGAGATAGLMLGSDQHKLRNAWIGAGLALVGGEIGWSKLWPSFKTLRAIDPRVNVNDLLNNYDYALKNGERYKVQAQVPLLKMVKRPEDRVALTRAIDSGTVSSLSPELQKAATHIKHFYDTIGNAAVERGIIPSLVDNYMNRAWVQDAKFKEVMDNINKQMATNMSGKSRHALLRKFVTLEQGKAAGLTPKTEDAVQLMGMYADSINQAMANKTLNESLRDYVIDPVEGTKAVMSINKAPAGYVTMSHPQLVGVKVHPSIAPSLDFLYHTYTNNAAVQLAEMLGSAIKRTNVGFSLFHTKNLIDAFFGANPLTRTPQNMVTVLKSLAGRSELHKQYMGGGAGDIVDLAMKGGVEFTPPKQHTRVEDVNTNFYDGLNTLQKFLETTIPIKGSGAPVAAIKKLNELNDKLLWENLHAGLKLATFSNAYGQLNKSWASALAKDPTIKVPDKLELANRAGSYTNDVFGGLNWRRLADEATNRYTRGLALTMASPAGRRLSQVLLFAPDWTYSTVRSWTKAIGQGSGLKGLLKPKTIADLHRQYLLRSGLIYMTLYNGINVALSGHPVWDNQDPLMVDMGNGEKMQANKHLLEVPHAILHPKAFALNKLGPLPSEAADQLLNLDYLNPNYSPPMQGSHLAHAAKRFLPFTAQGMQYKTPEARLLSVFGLPTYGMTPENKQKLLRDRREQRMEELMQGRK